jgi:beta-lactam-binding protein with PASTA domain
MSDERVLAGYTGVQALRADGPVRSYRATGADGADVCIKVVDADAESAKVTVSSLQTVQALQHPNLASIREQGLTDTGYYFVREWVEGSHMGTAARLSPEHVASAVAKGLSGVSAIHGAGLVCGDIRPSNFVVATDGNTRLVDFLVPPGRVGQGTAPAETAYYTSPEEIAGAAPSPSTDLYRAGLVLYEGLAGRQPFNGTDATEVIAGHQQTVPVAPSAANPQSPKNLDAVVAKALSKAPTARFGSADAMRQAIEAAVAPKTKLWLWITLAVVAVLVLFGLFSTQTEQGKAWMLGLRSMVAVPTVVGQTQAQAQVTLESAGLRLGQVSQEPTLAVAPGTVIGQTPVAGTTAKTDSAVDISVASLPSAKVPDVVGKTESEASELLAEEGLRVGTISYVFDSTVKPGYVISQTPSGGSDASVGSLVNLTVSKGTQTGLVPNVIGLPESDATAVLEGDGFKVTSTKATNTSVPAGDVSAQSPAAGAGAAVGSSVAIVVSTGAPAAEQPPAAAPPAEPAPPQDPQKPAEPPAPQPEKAKVPDVVGLSFKEAKTALKGANLKIKVVFAKSDPENALKVIEQDPGAGDSVDPGTVVTVTIGLPSFALEPVQLPAPTPPPTPETVPAPEPQPQPEPQPKPTPEPVAPTPPSLPESVTP